MRRFAREILQPLWYRTRQLFESVPMWLPRSSGFQIHSMSRVVTAGAIAAATTIGVICVSDYYSTLPKSQPVTVGDVTISARELDEYADSWMEYVEQYDELSISGDVYDETTKVVALHEALRQEAQKRGVVLDDKKLLEINDDEIDEGVNEQEYVNSKYGESGSWSRVYQETEVYKKIFRSELIKYREFFMLGTYVYVGSWWGEGGQDKFAAAKTRLEADYLPLFQQGLSKEGIAATADIDLVNYEFKDYDETETLAEHDQRAVVTTFYSGCWGECLYDQPFEDYGFDVGERVSANEALAGLENVGDHTAVQMLQTGNVAILRLENQNDGRYNDWDEYLVAKTTFKPIKTARITNMFGEKPAFAVSSDCGDSHTSWISISIKNVDGSSISGLGSYDVGRGFTDNNNPCVGLDTRTKEVSYDKFGSGYSWFWFNCDALGIVIDTVSGIQGDEPTDDVVPGWGIHQFAPPTPQNYEYDHMTWEAGNGSCTDGGGGGDYDRPEWSGLGNLNTCKPLSYVFYYRYKAFQPNASSVIQGSTKSGNGVTAHVIDNDGTITDAITVGVSGGGSWISDTTITVKNDLYRCDRPVAKISSYSNQGCSKVGNTISTNRTAAGTFNVNFTGVTQPGYYYVVTYILQNDASPSSNLLGDFYSAFHDDNEGAIVQFQPQVTSDVQAKYASLGGKFEDKITVSAVGGDANWLKDSSGNYLPVNVCVSAYGPYQQPQTTHGTAGVDKLPSGMDIPNNVSGSKNSIETVCNDMTPNSNTQNFTFNSESWTSGNYYFIEHIDKGSSNNADIKDFIANSYSSNFNPSDHNESGTVQFQPFVTSAAAQIWVSDSTTPMIADILTVHAAKDATEANNGYLASADSKDYWPMNSSGAFETAKFCVAVIGPYQQAQEGRNYANPPGGVPVVAGANWVGDAQCQDFAGPEVSKAFSWNTADWKPGFYYFMSYFRKADQTGTTTPPGLQGNGDKPIFAGDWTSQFNPKAEQEAVVDRFQIKAASKTRSSATSQTTVNTGIASDSNSDGVVNSSSDSGSAVTVLKPTDTYVEDSIFIRAYDTFDQTDVTDRDEYWLKDRNNNFISFRVCANVYGPYQQPQQRAPTNQYAGQTSLPTIPKNNNDSTASVREQCFWTNKLQGRNSGDGTLELGTDVVDGLVAKPTASGGPGEYKVRWSNNSFQPGYYYVVWDVQKGGENDKGTTVDLGSGQVTQENGDFLESNWYSPFGEQSESFYVQFQPWAKSDVQANYITSGGRFEDSITVYASDSASPSGTNSDANYWSDNDTNTVNHGAPVRVCVKAWGPYQQPQPNGVDALTGNAPEQTSARDKVCTSGQDQPGDFTYHGQPQTMVFNTAGWEPGYYYFTEHIVKNDQGSTQNLIIDNFDSKFNPSNEDEWGMVQFQPFVTSETPVIWVKDGENSITDKLTSHAAKDLAGAEDGYQAGSDLGSYWPKDAQGNYEVATFCVVPFGPYQNAQANGTVNGAIPKDGDAKNITVGPAAKALCLPFNGPEDTKNFPFDTFGWEPGYYYFMSYFRKGAVKSDDPDGVIGNDNRPIFVGDWVSKFNPSDEKEAVADKFQLKAASKTRSFNPDLNDVSMTVNTGIPADTHSNSSAGHDANLPDGIVDGQDSGSAVTVLKPTDTYVEDSIFIRAYDTFDQTDVTDRDEYWLKDRNNNFISFRVCANVYGPYQQPQQRAPTNQYAGQTSLPTIPKNNNDSTASVREQCFWTDKTITNPNAVDGLVAKPTASGGPGEYKVRFENSESGNKYFEPGYYYIVWNVDTNSTNETNSDADPAPSGACNGTANNCTTTVQLGQNRITRRNGDFLVSDWYSPFGEQSESFYAQFQPIAKSEIPETEVDYDVDRESKRTKSEGNEGIIMECDENRDSNTVNFLDNPEEYPHEKLSCQKVTDNIYLGAVSNAAITTDTSVAASHNEKYWPKNKDGLWETVKFQVKLYGPFKDANFTKNPTGSAVGLAGGTQISTVPANVYAAQGVYAQPVAESCVITTSPRKDVGGPNWNDKDNPTEAIFTQDFSSCHGNTPLNTTIELSPGIYTSVVEIVRDDEQTWPIKYNANYDKNGNSTQGYPTHNMLIRDRFTSVWGEPKETLLVPVPLYVVTRRGNSAVDTYPDQATISDQYWVNGFESKYVDDKGARVEWKDIFGNNIPKYGEYNGDAGYFNADIKSQAISVELYGPYPLADGRPVENDEYCRTDKLVRNGRWILPAVDTSQGGSSLSPSLTLYEKGWYVFQYTFIGGERISNIKTQCGDINEMFSIYKDEIILTTTAHADLPNAPTRITDTVEIKGNFTDDDKNSIVKLSLYKSARGKEVRPGEAGLDGPPLCTVVFTVSQAGAYTTTPYIDQDGYVREGALGGGRCFAETGGHYYWIEEFLRPGSDLSSLMDSDYIQSIGQGKFPESLDILPPTTPKVTTDADVVASVNAPFRDIAIVEDIPEGNTKPYYLYFTAFGPYPDGQINCTENLIYSSQANQIELFENGEYYSDFITVSSNGLVYWVEHLLDSDGEIVDEGTCGITRETTYVVSPPPVENSYDPFQVTPIYPDAGYFTRQVTKIIGFGAVSILGAWQLTSRNSWLLRKHNK